MLNRMLLAYVENGIGKGGLAETLAKKKNIPIQPHEAVMAAQKLEEDGYLTWLPLTRSTHKGREIIKEELKERTYFALRFEGVAFHRKGGYKASDLIREPVPPSTTILNLGHNYGVQAGRDASADGNEGVIGRMDHSLLSSSSPMDAKARTSNKTKIHWLQLVAWAAAAIVAIIALYRTFYGQPDQ